MERGYLVVSTENVMSSMFSSNEGFIFSMGPQLEIIYPFQKDVTFPFYSYSSQEFGDFARNDVVFAEDMLFLQSNHSCQNQPEAQMREVERPCITQARPGLVGIKCKAAPHPSAESIENNQSLTFTELN